MLVNCVAYQDGRKLADIAKEEIGKYVKRPDCFVWVALFEPSPAELQEMQQEFDLPELAVEDASHGHQRPKLEEYGNSLFAVLQPIELKGDGLQVGEIEIFVGTNYILSVRLRSERGFQSVRTRCESEPHLLKHGAAFVLYMAWSLALSVAALGAIGLATSLFSGRGPVYSATRQVVIGAVAAAITYAIGALIGVSLS